MGISDFSLEGKIALVTGGRVLIFCSPPSFLLSCGVPIGEGVTPQGVLSNKKRGEARWSEP